jgi:hypothetical protein
LAAPLTREEFEQAEAASSRPEAFADSKAHDSMYGAAIEALAAQREQLSRKRQ